MGLLKEVVVALHEDEGFEVRCSEGRPLRPEDVRPIAEHALDRGGARERRVILEEECYPSITELEREEIGREHRVPPQRLPRLVVDLFPDLLLEALLLLPILQGEQVVCAAGAWLWSLLGGKVQVLVRPDEGEKVPDELVPHQVAVDLIFLSPADGPDRGKFVVGVQRCSHQQVHVHKEVAEPAVEEKF